MITEYPQIAQITQITENDVLLVAKIKRRSNALICEICVICG
jgi:hypothetical protein